MIVFPNCKINLGLHITARRPDGYHNLETVFFPVRIYDVLEVIRKEGTSPGIAGNDGFTLHHSGIAVSGNPAENTCLQAWRILKTDFPGQIPPVDFYLHKAIPAGAGLGGGSADGAFTIRLLNEKFNLGISTEKMLEYALQLGSDCPFFIINKPGFATGRGEKLETISVALTGYKFLLVNPLIHISTREAFSNLTPSVPSRSIREIIGQPVTSWKDGLKNDFEQGAFEKYPELEMIKTKLYEAGAVYASMSGSGSTIYGIFKIDTPVPTRFPAHYFVKEINC